MKILFDHGTPAPLRHKLADHEISTTNEMGWANLQNGDLLEAAQTEFGGLSTTDKNLRYQQNLTGRLLAILVLSTTSWPRLQKRIPEISTAVAALKPGDYVELAFDAPP